MAEKKLTDAQPKSVLDRVARDLNRVLLHGARAQLTNGVYKPAMQVTGQQIRVEVPASDPMRFEFEVDGITCAVTVKNGDAQTSEKTMRAALTEKNEAKYLSLKLDPNIPTWVFSQREFGFPETPVPEDVVTLSAVSGGSAQTVLRLSTAALHEVQRVGRSCDVSLWKLKGDPRTGKVTGTYLPPVWRPALLLRFPLQTPKDPIEKPSLKELADGMVLELIGTPQGERYYLDQLGLLPDNDIGTPPEIEDVRLLLEGEPGETTDVSEWILARTNLTEEARPQKSTAVALASSYPYVATGSTLTEKQNTLRLLQMASITNSGGYYLRVNANEVPKALVVCVLLKPGSATHDFSVPVPRAANAIAYGENEPAPNVARFEDTECVHVTPFVPPGHAAFGWTREEPEVKSNDEENFGFGTISLVDYDAVPGAGEPLVTANACIAISPLRELPGENVPRATALQVGIETGNRADLRESASAALKVEAPHFSASKLALHGKARAAANPPRYYRAHIPCYDETKESPYAPLADGRRTITFSPGFRDVFGNRFKPQRINNPPYAAKLFYTDALIAPSEWPGIRLSLYPTTMGSQPAVSLEITYTPLPGGLPKTAGTVNVKKGDKTVKGKGTAFTHRDAGKVLRVTSNSESYDVTGVDEKKQELTLALPFAGADNPAASFTLVSEVDRRSRYLRLLEILRQLEGAKSDVKLVLLAEPVLHEADLTVSIINWLRKEVIPLEDPDKIRDDVLPKICPLAPFRCAPGTPSKPIHFEPHVQITRTDNTLLPGDTDWPHDPTLKEVIKTQITTTGSPVRLAEAAGPSVTLTDSDRKDEFQKVAEAFQTVIASHYNAQIGYLRDQFNEHQLWFLPDALFPVAEAEREWSYATARPLRQRLGNDEFLVPDFTGKLSPPSDLKYWEGYLLHPQRFVEQDFDDLCRTAFRLVEREAFTPNVVTNPSNVGFAKNCLQTKDSIARTLATWTESDDGYLVPLFKAHSVFDSAAITRLGKDAFLQNLNGFYRIDTVVQFPLKRAADKVYFESLQGKVENPFASPVTAAADKPRMQLPSFSDVLIKGGENRVTVFYDAPPGIMDPNSSEVPVIPDDPKKPLTITITHVQMPAGSSKVRSQVNSLNEKTGFNQGPWLELAAKKQLAWRGTGKRVPVAIRRFPLKPTIKKSGVEQSDLFSNGIVTAQNVVELVKWGWTVDFTAEGLSTDVVHAAVRYNEPEQGEGFNAFVIDEQFPKTLLQCLVILKLLGEHWDTIKAASRDPLPLLEKLFLRLGKLLSEPKVAALQRAAQPKDIFDINFEKGLPALSPGGTYEVMKGKVVVSYSGFSVGDFKDSLTFAAKVKVHSDSISAFIFGRLASSTREKLASWMETTMPSQTLQQALITSINTILAGESIWDEDRFRGVRLRPETQELLKLNPCGGGLFSLNRLLIEDAYPSELSSIALPLKPVNFRAKASTPGNNAFLLASTDSTPGPVRNFRPSLSLTRNESIDKVPLNTLLIYECATVEAARPARSTNLWIPPMFSTFRYRRKGGQSVLADLTDFFLGLFNGSPLDAFAMEVNVALHCEKEALTIQTPFSLIPVDLMRDTSSLHEKFTAEKLAQRVYDKAVLLLGAQVPRPPEVDPDTGSLRVRVKISDGDSNTVGRTCLEIGAIDFLLDQPVQRKPASKRSRRKSFGHT